MLFCCQEMRTFRFLVSFGKASITGVGSFSCSCVVEFMWTFPWSAYAANVSEEWTIGMGCSLEDGLGSSLSSFRAFVFTFWNTSGEQRFSRYCRRAMLCQIASLEMLAVNRLSCVSCMKYTTTQCALSHETKCCWGKLCFLGLPTSSVGSEAGTIHWEPWERILNFRLSSLFIFCSVFTFTFLIK